MFQPVPGGEFGVGGDDSEVDVAGGVVARVAVAGLPSASAAGVVAGDVAGGGRLETDQSLLLLGSRLRRPLQRPSGDAERGGAVVGDGAEDVAAGAGRGRSL